MGFRFYIKCTKCSSELTFKTDPEHSDYQAEFGCTRNYEPYSWRHQEEAYKEKTKKKEEIEQDAMASLEARTKQRKAEMDDLEMLDELKALSGRKETVGVDEVFDARKAAEEAAIQEEEIELASVVFQSADNIKRISEEAAIKPISITKPITKPKKKNRKTNIPLVPKSAESELSSLWQTARLQFMQSTCVSLPQLLPLLLRLPRLLVLPFLSLLRLRLPLLFPLVLLLPFLLRLPLLLLLPSLLLLPLRLPLLLPPALQLPFVLLPPLLSPSLLLPALLLPFRLLLPRLLFLLLPLLLPLQRLLLLPVLLTGLGKQPEP